MKRIVQIGPHGRGGMTSVIDNIMKSNIKNEYELLFLPTQYNHLNPFLTIKTYCKLKNMIRKSEVDIVHIHMASYGSFFRKRYFIDLCYNFHIPVVLHVHGACFKEFYEELSVKNKELVKKAFSKCSAIIGLTKDWEEFLVKLSNNKDKVHIVNNFVEIPSKSANPNNDIPNIVFLGRIGDRKGTFDLLNAFLSINKENKYKYYGYIAGDGEITKCNDFIRDNKMDNIKFLGWINAKERNELLLKTDIVILPSYYESFGMILIEAMSYKIPVIGGNAGSIPNVIRDKIDGYLVEPGNIKDIKEKLELLIENKDKRIKMGENGYKNVIKNYSSKVFEKRIGEIYNKIVKE